MARHLRKGRAALRSRQESAQVRAEERSKRSELEQMVLIGKRPGFSQREVAFITGKQGKFKLGRDGRIMRSEL
jgi:uncharacterized metal-binding protein